MTYLEAEAWATAHGLAIDLSVHRDAKFCGTPFDIEAAYCALIENLRAQVEADVVPLADAPRCAHCVEREKRIDSLAAENGRLCRELDVARLAAGLRSDDGGESGTITTNARVVRRHCVPVAGGHVVVEVPRRKA